MDILEDHGLTGENRQRLRPAQLRSLRSELEAVQKSTEAKVATVLDSRQMAEFRKIQEEARNRLRERLRNR